MLSHWRGALGCGGLLAFLLPGLVQAALYNYPGGVAELLLNKQSDEIPEVRYGIREPTILDAGSHWRVLIGIELGTLPGSYVVYVKPASPESTAFTENFQVQQRVYPIKEQHQIGETVTQSKRFSDLDYSNSAEPKLPLRFPVEIDAGWDESFGHLIIGAADELMVQNYVSLTTTALAPVLAPQDAIVSKITTDKQRLSTIYLDHGRGIYSIIRGVQDLSIETGNGVVAGAVIGKLPVKQSNQQTTTLYWQCVMNGIYVNPIVLTQL